MVVHRVRPSIIGATLSPFLATSQRPSALTRTGSGFDTVCRASLPLCDVARPPHFPGNLPIFYPEIRILRVAAQAVEGAGTGVALPSPGPAARCTKTLNVNLRGK